MGYRDKLTGIKVVVFDCDGVMFDSEKATRAFYDMVMEHFDLPKLTDEQSKLVHMYTVKDAFEYLISDNELRKRAFEYRGTLKYASVIRYMEMEPALIDLLDKLKGTFKIAIATNRLDTMHIVLDEFSIKEYFQKVVTAADVDNPKPHPEQLYKIMDFFGVDSKEMVYIGDSVFDEKAAIAAEIPFIAYNNTGADGADFHISSLSEVAPLLGL